VNAIPAPTFRNGILNADRLVEQSDADEPQTEGFGAAESAKSAEVRYRMPNAADVSGNLDQLPDFFWRRWNYLPVFQGRQPHAQCMVCERETAPECTRSFAARQHIAEEHDGIMNRLWGEFVLNHATDDSIDVLEPNGETVKEPRRGLSWD
jgi:hypothetical protein